MSLDRLLKTFNDNIQYYNDVAELSSAGTGTELKRIYIENNKSDSAQRYNQAVLNHIGNNQDAFNMLRIMTWNVRSWSNLDEAPTFDEINKVIRDIDPDIVCLQEVIYGYTTIYPNGVPSLKNDAYEVLIFCNIVPSWQNTPYGNLIMIKKKLIDKYRNIHKYNKTNPGDPIAQHILPYLCGTKHCDFLQRNVTFNEPRSFSDINKYGKFGETRCYIRISLLTFDIYCVHFEDSNGELARNQLEQLFSDIEQENKHYANIFKNQSYVRPVIIAGDFNMIDTKLYDPKNMKNFSEATQIKINSYWEKLKKFKGNNLFSYDQDTHRHLIESYRYTDSFEFNEAMSPMYTQWAGSKVDYILFNDEAINKLSPNPDLSKTYTYFTNASDHIPIIVEIENFDYLPYLVNVPNLENIIPEKIVTPKEFMAILNSSGEKLYGFGEKLYGYNFQPLTVSDWFMFDQKTNDFYPNEKFGFNDPRINGNSADANTLGITGLYVGLDFNKTKLFGSTISGNEMIKDNNYIPYGGYNICYQFLIDMEKIQNIYVVTTNIGIKFNNIISQAQVFAYYTGSGWILKIMDPKYVKLTKIFLYANEMMSTNKYYNRMNMNIDDCINYINSHTELKLDNNLVTQDHLGNNIIYDLTQAIKIKIQAGGYNFYLKYIKYRTKYFDLKAKIYN